VAWNAIHQTWLRERGHTPDFSKFVVQNLMNYADDIRRVKSLDCEVGFWQLLLVRAQQRENGSG
jgi:hypothetical protein